jgi:hypothetical protein
MTQPPASPDSPDAADGPRQFRTTAQTGWHRYLEVSPSVPNPPGAYDRPASTAAIRQVQERHRLALGNRNTGDCSPGLVINGEPHTGKTTTITQMGIAS